MGIARSTYYDRPQAQLDDTALVQAIAGICDAFEAYGWRRVRAALRQQGIVVNHKRIRRLMREHGLQPKLRRRFVRTTDSDHDQPIFRDRRKEVVVDGPDRLWVADLTYVAIATGFVYVAVILDAWSRRVVGYAIGRTLDARLTVAALKAAIELRQPSPGCIHHSDRGSQGRDSSGRRNRVVVGRPQQCHRAPRPGVFQSRVLRGLALRAAPRLRVRRRHGR